MPVEEIAGPLADASRALGQLDGIGRILPDPDLLVRPYMRREAVLSSRIEGTRTSFTELLAFEATGRPPIDGDVRDVFNYLQALDYGLRHVDDAGITMDLVRDMHRHLMTGARGERFTTPGEFRNMQNHIGDSDDPALARFVPPPADRMHEGVEQLFGYLSRPPDGTPVLIEAAWMHYQFEALHPFLDGNGRVGRLLIPLLLAHRHHLTHPLLYLSPFFEARRGEYYDRLFAVSARSDWLGWLLFFLEGVRVQAEEGLSLADSIIALGKDWHQRLHAARASHNAHRLVDLVHQRIVVDAKGVERELEVSTQTSYALIRTLQEANILHEQSGRTWGRLYLAVELNDILDSAR